MPLTTTTESMEYVARRYAEAAALCGLYYRDAIDL